MGRETSRSVVSLISAWFSACWLAACAFEALPMDAGCADPATCMRADSADAGVAAVSTKTREPLPRTYVPADAGAASPDAALASDCASRDCASTCPEGMRDCNGTCAAACDGCEECAPGRACVEGPCDESCPPGTERCGDSCVDLARDVHHCGACGSACPTGADVSVACEAGECTFTCKSGYRLCRGQCIPDVLLFPEPLDFPICDALIAPGAALCPPRLHVCDGICADLQNDRAHCGTCDSECPAGARCRGARCVQ